MNPTTRFLVVLACLIVAALESPRAATVIVQDVAGPYAARGLACGSASLDAPRVCTPPSRASTPGPVCTYAVPPTPAGATVTTASIDLLSESPDEPTASDPRISALPGSR